MLYLHGIGHFHPNNIIDNAFLESLDIGVDSNWVIERVGIEQRRTVLPLDYIRHTKNKDPREANECAEFSNAETGMMAARMAMERADIEPDQIGLVIAGGCSPQYSAPAEASRIAATLGIAAPAFDLNSACSTFIAQCHFLNGMMPEALPRFVLLVNVENITRVVNYTDRRSAVLFGDASSAAVLSKTVWSHTRIEHTSLQSDPAGWDKITIASGGHFEQNGSAVQQFAIRKSVETINELRSRGPGMALSAFIGHQANRLMLDNVCARAGIEPASHLFNVDRFGNGGAAGAPTVLSQNWDRLPEGPSVMAIVGAGLTWGGLMMHRGPANDRC